MIPIPRWHFGPPSIPATAVLLSLIALAIPVIASLIAGAAPVRFEGLLWLTVLVPAFLLAYYKGAFGVATGLAIGMVVFSLVQVYLIASAQRLPDWPFILSIAAALILVSLVVGRVADQLHLERERAERLALFDPLTQLPNRRYLELILEKEFAAAKRGRRLVVVAFDLDGLKAINDRYGHTAGDEALKAFANVLDANTRSMNLSARLGGDEFVSVVSEASIDGALVFVRRVQKATEALSDPADPVTVSAGLALCTESITDPVQLLEAADSALYRAKNVRGSFVVYDSDAGAPTSPVAT